MRRSYKHNCDKCVFLGAEGKHDLYACTECGMTSRFGSEPCSVLSPKNGDRHIEDVLEAMTRIMMLGVLFARANPAKLAAMRRKMMKTLHPERRKRA